MQRQEALGLAPGPAPASPNDYAHRLGVGTPVGQRRNAGGFRRGPRRQGCKACRPPAGAREPIYQVQSPQEPCAGTGPQTGALLSFAIHCLKKRPGAGFCILLAIDRFAVKPLGPGRPVFVAGNPNPGLPRAVCCFFLVNRWAGLRGWSSKPYTRARHARAVKRRQMLTSRPWDAPWRLPGRLRRGASMSGPRAGPFTPPAHRGLQAPSAPGPRLASPFSRRSRSMTACAASSS